MSWYPDQSSSGKDESTKVSPLWHLLTSKITEVEEFFIKTRISK